MFYEEGNLFNTLLDLRCVLVRNTCFREKSTQSNEWSLHVFDSYGDFRFYRLNTDVFNNVCTPHSVHSLNEYFEIYLLFLSLC